MTTFPLGQDPAAQEFWEQREGQVPYLPNPIPTPCPHGSHCLGLVSPSQVWNRLPVGLASGMEREALFPTSLFSLLLPPFPTISKGHWDFRLTPLRAISDIHGSVIVGKCAVLKDSSFLLTGCVSALRKSRHAQGQHMPGPLEELSKGAICISQLSVVVTKIPETSSLRGGRVCFGSWCQKFQFTVALGQWHHSTSLWEGMIQMA